MPKAPLRKIILGTRGSELALAQTGLVVEALSRAWPSLDIAIEVVRTRGEETAGPIEVDRLARTAGSSSETFNTTSQSPRLAPDKRNGGRKGLFTAELEEALIEKRIDVAVHSAKDLPSESDGGLVLTAVLPRGAVEDLLLRKSALNTPLITVATGSVRRQRQLLWTSPTARILPLSGNVPTRLRKFIRSNWDAIILARAGLERLGFLPPEFEFEGRKVFAEILPLEKFVPAGGQGIIALQTRTSDLPYHEIVSAIDDHRTHLCLRAEREFLRHLHGDCDLPVGAHARAVNCEIELRGQVFGDTPAPKMACGCGSDPERLGREVFQKIEREQEFEDE